MTTYRALIDELAGNMPEDRLKVDTCWYVKDHLEGEGVNLDAYLLTKKARRKAVKRIKQMFARMLSHKRYELSKFSASAPELERHIEGLEAIVAS